MKYFHRNTKHLRQNFLFGFLAIGLLLVLPALTLAAPGDLDPTFGNGGSVITSGNNTLNLAGAMAIQADGKIVVVGEGSTSNTWDFAVVRYNTNGSLDTSFGGTGIVLTPVGNSHDFANSVVIQADGKIVVAGSICNGVGNCSGAGISFAVVRYNPNGSLDTSFNGTGKVITSFVSSNGFVGDLAIQADGKIVAAFDFVVVRYNSNGSLDTSFNGTGIITPVGRANSVVIQTDGKVVVAGIGDNGSSQGFAIFRYNTDGSPDTSFNGTGKVVTQIGTYSSGANSVAIQTDGKIVAVGNSNNGSNSNFALVRYNPNGSLDNSLGGTGKVTIPIGNFGDYANSVAIQTDGKIVAAGYSYHGNYPTIEGSDFAVVRFNSNGSLDTTFNGTGKVITQFGGFDYACSVAIQADGKIIAAGAIDYASDFYDFALVRYQGGSSSNIRTRFDFDGDGRADISVFRPDIGAWYLNQSANGFTGVQFGLLTDKLVPADYDGDGKTDVAVFRDGFWYWLNSSNGSFQAAHFGQAGDIPVPADYTGDGRAEIAVFRGGFWYSLNLANNQFQGVQFGLAFDKPVAADYDGDGKADIAVVRQADGVSIWYILGSSQGFYGLQFGTDTDKLVAADYDGDGKADVAVFRPSNGVWYLQQSTAGFTGIAFGLGTDLPTPADYDGDGKTDVAVFRNGTWYLQRSQAGFAGVAFGASTDKPIPNAFVP